MYFLLDLVKVIPAFCKRESFYCTWRTGRAGVKVLVQGVWLSKQVTTSDKVTVLLTASTNIHEVIQEVSAWCPGSCDLLCVWTTAHCVELRQLFTAGQKKKRGNVWFSLFQLDSSRD